MYNPFPWLFRLSTLLSTYFGDLDKFGDSGGVSNSNLAKRSASGNGVEIFDFIIVGAGSSGSVLANRLSENFSVLLLEAGGLSNPISLIPGISFPNYWHISEDWKYETVPQKYAGFGLNNNITHWSAGKGLGGSSLINGMIHIRGTVQGFDTIAEQVKDPIWKMKNVLKYYKKIEDYHGYFDQKNHGENGKINVEKGHLNSYVVNLMRAGEELGYKVRDPNPFGPLTEGFAPNELHTKDGLRWSAFNGYIEPILNSRPQFTVRKYSHAYKVILDEDNVATAVEYLRHGKRETVSASKEVILSAGAIQSPKILLLSGIGPKADLKSLGIPVKLDLPVGQRLQDKFGAFVGPFIVDPGQSFAISREFTLPGLTDFLVGRRGPFTSSQSDATYSIRSQVAISNGDSTPDIHAYIGAIPLDRMDSTLEKRIFTESLNFKHEMSAKYFRHAYGKDAVLKVVTLNKPQGFGTLKLRDKEPMSVPLIDPNYLENQNDVDTLVEGIKFAVKVMEETKSLKKINTKLIPIPIPGCKDMVFKSDAYWECLGRHMTATAYKYCSTVPLGKDNSDPIAVVDSRLRVLGAKKLRVVDASVLQERYVSVNHVTCTMLGELASDFILKEYLNN